MQIGNHKDLVSGLMFAATGLAFILVGRQYSIGTAAEMGAGYFPALLGAILFVTGMIIAGRAFSTRGGRRISLPSFDWLTALIVLGSIAFFAVSLERLGVILTTIGAVIIARLATRPMFSVNSVVTAFAIATFCTLLFKYGLDLPLPVWPSALDWR